MKEGIFVGNILLIFFICFIFIETIALLKVAKISDEKIEALNRKFFRKR